MTGEIIPYIDMCKREGISLQKGMNWRIAKTHSVFLMSVRKGAPYDDRVEDNGRTLIYEGHDAHKTKNCPTPKVIDQPRCHDSGSLTENGLFENAALDFKNGKKNAELIRVYEKLRPGLWAYNGLFKLTDCWMEQNNGRKVFKFRLAIEEENSLDDHATDISATRYIPSAIKQAVFLRDDGKCVECGATDNLHFDHILPYSLGGTSISVENVQILCARHNLSKSATFKY